MAKARARRTLTPAFSMLELSPLYGEPAFEYRDAKQLLVLFQTDSRVLRRLIPPPLTPNKDSTMFIAISEFFTSGFGNFNELLIASVASFKRAP